MLTEALRKRSLRPTQRRALAEWFVTTYGTSVHRACQLAGLSRTGWYRRPQGQDQSVLRARIRELAHARPRFGFTRIWVLLRREGWQITVKRVRRLYRLEGLQLRMRVRRRMHIALHRGPAPVPLGPQERWSMDLV
jgi:putative transposase